MFSFYHVREKYRTISVDIKASLWFTIMGFVQKGMAFITTPIFTRILTTDEYGIYSLYLSWYNILIVFASLNLASGVFMRGLVKYKKDKSRFVASMTELGIVCFLICFLVYICFHSFFNSIFSLPTYIIIAMFVDILANMIFQFWSATERVDFHYVKLIILTLVVAIIRPLTGVICILLFQNKVGARIISMVVVDLLFYSGLLIKLIYYNKRLVFSSHYWKYGLSFNLPLIPHYLSQIILSQSDRIMVNKYCSTSDVAIYSLAYTAATIMLILNNAIINSLNPWIYKKIDERRWQEIGNNTMNYLFVIAIANLLLIVLAPEAMLILGSKKYISAIWVIPPVSLSSYFMFMYSLFAAFEFYYEKTKYIMIATSICAISNIILNAVFIPKYGFVAAGYTTLFCYVGYALFHYLFMKKILKNNEIKDEVYNSKKIFLFSVGFSLVCFLITYTYSHIIIRYSLVVILAITIFLKRKKLFQFLGNKSK